MKPLPTREDFVTFESLDEISAFESLGGKSLEEVQALCQAYPLAVCEDLLFMGDEAYDYYVQAAIDYIRSPQSAEDDAMCSAFYAMLSSRADARSEMVREPRIRDALDFVIQHFEKFNVSVRIYGDLRAKYVTLRQQLFDGT